MRIAVISKPLCKPSKCGHECIKVCPVNRSGEKCVFLSKYPEGEKSAIDEELCVGCGLCVKACPYYAIQIVNTPEKLKENPIHRFGRNGFTLFRLPFPVKGEVVGLLGPNGVGKTTTLKLLSGDIKPNTGKEKVDFTEVIKLFRGTELQNHLEGLKEGKLRSVIKPQQVDILRKVENTVSELLEKYDEKGKKDEMIKRLSLTACLNRKTKMLSGGELQRLAIAIVALRKADIYYIDEPSSYLDVFQRLEAGKLIRELAKEAAVMVVEHDLASLDFMADRIHVFYGAPGAFGVVSKPYSTRVGINAFLDGFIKEDNVRIREEKMEFDIGKRSSGEKYEVMMEWPEISKTLGGFSMKISAGNLKKGEILGIFGSNALGKTTFAKMLAGELKPNKGKIENIVKISYKPQYISTDYSGTVMELFQTVVDDPYSEEFKSTILEPLMIERLVESKVSTLSGGELQRVTIGLALSKKADLYLLDEPSAYLDSEQRLEVAKMIQRISETKECSFMIIDHDLLFLSYLSDRALLFSGESGISGSAIQCDLQEGFNSFLKKVNITFRKDPQTKRPRANKPGSQKDQDQKKSGTYFFVS